MADTRAMPKSPDVFVHTLVPGQDPFAALQQAMHDCPDCRAALERGEQPVFGSPPPPSRRRNPFPRPARWRTRKQRP